MTVNAKVMNVDPIPRHLQAPMDSAQFANVLVSLEAATTLLRQSLLSVNALPARVDQQLQDFKAQMQTEITVPLLERMSKIEADQRDAILINPNEKQQIREAIAAKVREFCPAGKGKEKHFARLYGRLHREFGTNTYEGIRRVDLNQSLKYITTYDGQLTTWATK